MTDMEKLLKGINLIKESCHNDDIVDDFHVITITDDRDKFKNESYRVTFMMATGYERESLMILFDKDGNFITVF